MTAHHDLERRVADYYATEAPQRAPDRVLEQALATIESTQQRRLLGLAPWRFRPVSTYMKLAIAAAAVVAVAILGYKLLPNEGVVGTNPSPSPSPTAPSSSPTPSISAAPAMLEHAPLAACGPGGGPLNCLAPGTYRLTGNVWPGEITLDVPAGWFEWLPLTDRDAYDALLVGPDGSGWGLEFMVINLVAKDPCDPSKGTFARVDTGTVDELIAAINTWPGFEATAPVPTLVSGYNGQLVELTSTRTGTDCPNSSVWTIPQGGGINAYPMVGTPGKARAGTFRIVDVNGTLLVIRTTEFPDTSPNELSQGIPDDPTRHTAELVVLQQILDSIKVTGG
jgi:hypothetical protein